MFITPEEFRDLSVETLNSVLERTYNRAIEDTLCLLPEVILSLIVKTKGTQQTLETFIKSIRPSKVGRLNYLWLSKQLSLLTQLGSFQQSWRMQLRFWKVQKIFQ